MANNKNGKANINNIKDFATFCAQLVKEGVIFEAYELNDGSYEVVFTGGF